MRSRLAGPILVPAVAALAALAAGCGDGGSGAPGDDAAVSAVATTTHVADFVREVGGERVDVHQILQPGSDPHGFEPRPSDIGAIVDADVVVRSGGEVDEWIDDVVDGAGADVEVVDLLAVVDTIEVGGHEHGDEVDPHWWQSPPNVALAADEIAAALAGVDRAGAAAYERRAAEYGDRLRALDREVAACVELVGPAQRELVTTHGALGYYAERYGLELVGALIPSLSTAAQPSAGETQELVDQIRARDVAAIFPESAIGASLEEAVARETGAEVGAPLWSDSLGPEGSGGETYVESIRANTDAIVSGLTRGRRGCGG